MSGLFDPLGLIAWSRNSRKIAMCQEIRAQPYPSGRASVDNGVRYVDVGAQAETRDAAGRRAACAIQPCITIRVCSVISNCTGRWVFCCRTMALRATESSCAISCTRILTRSQARNLLSIAKLNNARSRMAMKELSMCPFAAGGVRPNADEPAQ